MQEYLKSFNFVNYMIILLFNIIIWLLILFKYNNFIVSGYVTTIIEDAELYSSHAKKKSIDMDDVKLAISLQHERNFANPPSREVFSTYFFHY